MARRENIVIVSNRLPVHRVGSGRGARWETSPGGLVSALTPILRNKDSIWVGWTGDSAGKRTEPFTHDSIRNVPVQLSKADLEGYYDGFSNATLWPLYHDAIRPPEYHRHWWRPYKAVNERFAKAALEHVSPKGTVWVQDYHLQLAPAMIRSMKPGVKVGFFLHIPFPPQELFAQLPWRREILEGLLGADVVGFQTKVGAQNFCQLCRRFTDATGRGTELSYQGRTVRAQAFPISIDTERFESLARDPEVTVRSADLREALSGSRRVILGVDRLDYTKGIDRRLRAFQELLRSGRWTNEDCVFVQVAVPSRERVAEYIGVRRDIEELTGQINGEFGQLGMNPVQYMHRSLPIDELTALYLAADVMLVTPLRDGMNLVAKEYIATRLNDTGVLVLSEFTGSAKELKQALMINPHDINGLTQTIEDALDMSESEQRTRMRSLRRIVQKHTVYDWANGFFEVLNA